MSAVPRCIVCDARMNPYGVGGTTCRDCLDGLPPKSGAVWASWYLDEHPELRLTECRGDPLLNRRNAA